MKILYIGDQNTGSTSRHRCDALRRLGHEVLGYDPYSAINWNRLNVFIHYRTGYVFVSSRVRRHLFKWLGATDCSFDLIWVDNGQLISAETLMALKSLAKKLVNYNCDDPTGRRDGMRWFTFLRSIKCYDLCVVVRRESGLEYPLYGARDVLRVWRSADEVAHAPRVITPEIHKEWKSEVVFVGTWMPERGPFMLELVQNGIPLSIWGNRWHKAKEWPHLKQFWRGGALGGDKYCYAIQCAKINLGLLSKGNRDLHTQRTAEIPALGALFCAERTSEHLELYNDGEEAILWTDAKDCSLKIKQLLSDESLRGCIQAAGHRRWLSSELKNEVIVRNVLLHVCR